jgi:hypothetical protein
MTRERDLKKDLTAMRIKLELHKKNACAFSEEAVVQNVIYAVGNALDILNGKKSLLQGLIGKDNGK